MHPYGSDRVRVRDDGAVVLSCRVAKEGWQARVAKTLTTSEHPGTAVLWDDECFEVLEIEVLANSVSYTLGPWGEQHTMRAPSTYDAATETQRIADRRDVVTRVKGRHAATLLGFLTGHLPAAVQEQIANETGTNAPRLTIVSAIPELAPSIICLNMIVAARMGLRPTPDIPVAILLLSGYMAISAVVRAAFAFLNARPMGSVLGLIGYGIYYLLSPKRGKRIGPLAAPRGEGTFQLEIADDVKLRDAAKMREPLFTLLSPAEQQRIAARFDYDYRHTAASTAWGILIFALLGVVTSVQTLRIAPRPTAFLSLITAGYLMVEQIVRLTQLSDRPIGSILGVIARPLSRKFVG